MIIALFMLLFQLAILAFILFCFWKLFEKAGRPGWEGIVPIYNMYILVTQIVGRPILWFILMLIPIANIVAIIVVMLDLAKAFGQSPGFGVGLILLGIVFIPILAFGPAKYVGKVFNANGGGGFPVK